MAAPRAPGTTAQRAAALAAGSAAQPQWRLGPDLRRGKVATPLAPQPAPQSLGAPAVEAVDGTWQDLAFPLAGPTGRTNASSVYDPVRRRMIVFGGLDGAGILNNDVWVLSLSGTPAWTQIVPQGPSAPYVRYAQAAVYDSKRDRILVFGGYSGLYMNDVWALNLSGTPAWTQVMAEDAPGAPPNGRFGPTAIYDPQGDRLVTFGGYMPTTTGNALVNTTYALSLSGTPTWSEIPTANPPIPMTAFFGGAYEPQRNSMLVVGATTSSLSSVDVWELSFSGTPAWSRVIVDQSVLPPRTSGSAMTFDGVNERIYFAPDNYYAGVDDSLYVLPVGSGAIQQWALVGSTVNLPAQRGGSTAIFDPVGGRYLQFGGSSIAARPCNQVLAMDVNGKSSWTVLMDATGTPPALLEAGYAYDSLRNRLLLFGGTYLSGNSNEVWALNLTGNPVWTELLPQGNPPSSRYGSSVAYDPAHDRLVVFGGRVPDLQGGGFPDDALADAYTLSLSGFGAWSTLAASGSPPARGEAASAFDPVANAFYVLGGTDPYDPGGPVSMWKLSLAGAPTWSSVPLGFGVTPAQRANLACGYDPALRRIFVFGGQANGTVYGDTWWYDLAGGTGWTGLSAGPGVPAPRQGASLVFDPDRGRMLLFSGVDPNAGFADTWALSLGAIPAWTALNTSGPAAARPGPAAAYDPVAHRMIAHGPLVSDLTTSLTSVLQLTPAVPVPQLDLTTFAQSKWARYLVNVGANLGDTHAPGSSAPGGVSEISNASGNDGPWWFINDGKPDRCNTYGGTGPDYVGYRFKYPVDLAAVRFDNATYCDGGTFQGTPAVQVFDGVTWTTVGASCTPPYDASFGCGGTRTYEFTLTTPAQGVRGVRLFGPTAGTADGDGFVGVSELTAFGAPRFPRQVDLAVDLTSQVGTEGWLNGGIHNEGREWFDDDGNTSAGTSGISGVDDNMGVLWASPQDSVTAMGVLFEFDPNGYGGWIDESVVPLTIESTSDHGATWQPVTGLTRGTYDTDYPLLATGTPSPRLAAYLFTFDPLSGINGLRIRGDGGGTEDGDGAFTVHEMEVFASSARQLPPPPPRFALHAVGTALQRRYTNQTAPSVTFAATAAGVPPASGNYLASVDARSGHDASLMYLFSSVSPVPLRPEVPASAPMQLFQTERFGTPVDTNFVAHPLHWTFPVPSGTYDVTLFFAEISSASFTSGARVFRVQLEGATVLDNFDIFAAVGPQTGTQRTFGTTVTDGTLDVELQSIVGDPVLSGIEVRAHNSSAPPLYRLNCGGPALAAPDGSSPQWEPDRDGLPSSDFRYWAPDTTWTLPTLAEGLHVLDVQSRALGAQRDSLFVPFLVDTTPPVPALPLGVTDGAMLGATSATFTLGASDNFGAFVPPVATWRLDHTGSFKRSVSGVVSLTSLTPGAHVFEASARDTAGNIAVPRAVNFNVDLTKPTALVTFGPADGDTVTSTATAFSWTGSDDLTPVAQLRYQSSFDGGAFSAPSAVVTRDLSGLSDGPHTFHLQALDLAGNVSDAVSRGFFLDAHAPSVSLDGVASGGCTATPAADFTWTIDDGGITPPSRLLSSFRLDGAAFSAYQQVGAAHFTALAQGPHTFDLHVRDASGNTTNLTRSFTVDLESPFAYAPTARVIDNQRVSVQATGTDNHAITQFVVQVAESTLFVPLLIDTVVDAGGQLTFQGVPGHTYYARAQAIDCAGSHSPFSPPSAPAPVANLPDLVVSNVTGPSQANSGQVIQVTWKVSNQGLGGTSVPSWSDRLYLCDSRTFDASRATALGDFENLTFLASQEAYDGKLLVSLPRVAQGKYFLFVAADADAQLAEADGTNNLGAPDSLVITQSNAANLDVSAQQAPDEEIAGDVITITYKVHNYGLARTDVSRWYDTVFLADSTNLRINAAGGNNIIFLDQPLGVFQHDGALDPDSEYVNIVRVRLPETNAETATKHLFVFADQNVAAAGQSVPQAGSVFENGADFNFGTSGTVLQRDILVHARSSSNLRPDSLVAPAAATSGTDVPVHWTVSNRGLGSTLETAWVDRVYLSTDPTLQTNADPLIASEVRYGSLAVDDHYDVSRTVHLPDFKAGDFYLIVKTDADGQVPESDESDNVVSTVTPIHVTLQDWPNLVVSSAFVPDQARAGSAIQVAWEVRNAGLGTAVGPWSDRLSLTPTPTWDPNVARMLLPVLGTSPLGPQDLYDRTSAFVLPPDLPQGTYTAWLETDAYGQVDENTDEGDNRRLAGTIQVAPYPPVDLATTRVTAPATAATGQAIDVTWQVANLGQGTTLGSSWYDQVWLSTDSAVDPTDFVLGVVSHGGTVAGADGYAAALTGTIPDGFPPGDYYVLVRADQGGQSGDGLPANNLAVSAAPVHVVATDPPNLVARDVSVLGPTIAGQPVTVQWTEANTGTGPTVPAAWATALYLSTDAALNDGDVPLASTASTTALLPGGQVQHSLSVELPNYAAGPYYVLAFVDAQHQVYEAGAEGDNIAVSAPVTVALAPPADLVAESVQGPATASPGDPIAVTWTDRNLSTTNAATGIVRDVVYVSADTTFDPDTDPVLGVVTRTLDLPPQQAAAVTISLPMDHTYRVDDQGNVVAELPALSPGFYHLIVRTNVKRNIRELDYGNNLAVCADSMHVDIPILPLGSQVTVSAAAGQSRYFRVDTPAGKDVQLSVTSDVSDATNLLYAAFGHTPSPGSYDFVGPPEFTSAPSISIPGSLAGSYYLLAYTDALPPGPAAQMLTVAARALPFHIASVSPDSGAGSITCTIEGAGFGANTRFYMQIAPNFRIEAARTIVTSLKARATFNLVGCVPGVYPILAVNPESTVTAPTGFSVQVPEPLALQASIDRPDFVRQNQTGTFTVHLRNTSNQDVPYVQARVVFPGQASLVSLAASAGLLRRSDIDPAGYAPVSGDVMELPDSASSDSLAAVDVVGRGLPPGQEFTLTLGIRGFGNSRFSVRALTAALTTDQYIARAIDDIEAVRLAASSAPSGLPFAVQALLSDPAAFRDSALARTWVASGLLTRKAVTGYVQSLSPGNLGGSSAPQVAGPDELLVPSADCVLPTGDPGCNASLGAIGSVLPGCASCFPTADPLRLRVPDVIATRVARPSCLGFAETAVADLQVVSPCDPNVINGPAGFGSRHWVNRTQTLGYTVNFENLPDSASAAAQVVKVRVPISPTVDLQSFRLGAVGFGTHVFTHVAGLTKATDSLFIAERGIQVNLLAGVDETTTPPQAFWTLTTIDPATHQVPTSNLGFLPVNNSTGDGTGFANFTVVPAPNLATGAAIQENASVQFDFKIPLPTATIVNPVDAGRPTSHVTDVAALSSSSVRVRWADSDDSTGVSTVQVFVQQDGGAFQQLASGLTGNEAVLPVNVGSRYGFYTLATDNAGNVEATKSTEEATVQVPGTVDAPGDGLPRVFALLQNAPNPFRDGTVIRFDLPRPAVTSLEVYNVAGRRLATPLAARSLPAGRHEVALRASEFAPGVYFYRIAAGSFRSTRKMVVVP